MRSALAEKQKVEVQVRRGGYADLRALLDLENEVFHTDRLSRQSLRRFLASPNAELMVAEVDGRLAGYALVLFRSRASTGRLYSIAISPSCGRRGVGKALLAAAEQAALARHCTFLRLEVHENNAAAIALYRQAGYRQFGRHEAYYGDSGAALRLQKRLYPVPSKRQSQPPYFHQTTEFTCGPACLLMALAWADPALRPDPAFEFKLWREATTIFMSGGPGGCEPYGLAVTLRRHGLVPEIYVSHPGPYFVDTVQAEEKRRVMRIAQAEFRREAHELGISTYLKPLGESGLIDAFDSGAVAIVMVAGDHMFRRRLPHWVFAFAHEGRAILVHDPAAGPNDQGEVVAPETYAMPSSTFERMTRCGVHKLQASILVRKGPVR
ncbi:MAG: peptidase C39 family protein [Xanthobacteraceae bacterium]